MPDVRCIDCGLLALRHKGNRTLVEAEQAFRNSGESPSQHAHYPSEYEPLPICLPRVINFRETVGENPPGFTGRLLKALREPQNCLGFKEWEQGFTPKEHQEMKHEEWLLDFQTKREDADRKWRQEQAEREHQREQERAKADQDWRERQAKAEHEWQRTQGQWRDQESETDSKRYAMTLALSIIAAIVFQGIVSLLGSAIQAGWVSRPW